CRTDKVYPCAQCRFQVKYNFIYYIYTDYTITHDNLKISNDPIYYKTTCTLKIARRNLTHGVYDIDVIISPNITGGDNDMKYGAKTTIHVNPADQFQGVSIVSIGAFITIIVSGAVCFISICCVVVHKRQQGGNHLLDMCLTCTQHKKVNTGYDEINDGYILAVQDAYQGQEQYVRDSYMQIESTLQSNFEGTEINGHIQEYNSPDIDIFVPFQVEEPDNTDIQEDSYEEDSFSIDTISSANGNDMIAISTDKITIGDVCDTLIAQNIHFKEERINLATVANSEIGLPMENYVGIEDGNIIIKK
ncbi:unnamed protein product, partial [Lymnaea stagnalis]